MIKNNKVGNDSDNKNRDNTEVVIYIIIYLFVGERSSVVNTLGTRVRLEVPHPSEKNMKNSGIHGVCHSA